MDNIQEFAEDVSYQFGCYVLHNGRLAVSHGGLSTLEWAFDILDWKEPHPCPECECQFPECHERATCGHMMDGGYKILCGKHFREVTE